MAKVTPVTVASSTRNLGEFKVESFSMFDPEDLELYADFRNKANDAAFGIKIEMMREYSRKTTTREGEGESAVFTTTEEIILVVHYWAKPLNREKGESDDESESRTALVSGG